VPAIPPPGVDFPGVLPAPRRGPPPPGPSASHRRVRRLCWCAIVAGAAVVAFSSGLPGDLLRWDDDRLVADNPLVGPPYVAHTLKLFTTIQNEAYQPLHIASYQIDRALWNLHPVGCHLFNLALYAAALCLLLRFLERLGVPLAVAALGLLVYALHPSHVESVVWISGRKDVLSLVLVAAALLLYVRSDREFDLRHVGSLVLFLLAGLAKTTALFLPLWLPLVDRWAFRRPWRTALLRAAPLAAAAATLGGLVTWIWHHEGLTRTLASPGSRLAIAPKVLLHYAYTVVAPVPDFLSPLYPVDRFGAFDGRALAGLALLAGFVALLWYTRHAAPGIALGVAVFLLGLLPVSNLIPMVFQVNDRYLLLPLLGVPLGIWGAIGMVERGTPVAASRRRLVRWVVPVAALGVAIVGGWWSFDYSFAWRSDLALWEHAAAARPDAYYVRMKLGETYRDHGRFDQADAEYAAAVALEPDLLPARGGRMLNCLTRADRERAPASREVPLETVKPYVVAYGDARAMLQVARSWFALGYVDCSYLVLLEATEVRPPLPDREIIRLARDWVRLGRTDRARELLARVSAEGKATVRWQDADAEVRAGTTDW
jgi:hypothetical protein